MSDNREEWEVELEKRKMLQDSLVTDMRKSKFVDDIISGLGEELLKEPNKIQGKPKKESLLSKFKKLF